VSHVLQSFADHASYLCRSEPPIRMPNSKARGAKLQLECVPGTQAGIGGWGQRAERRLRAAAGELQGGHGEAATSQMESQMQQWGQVESGSGTVGEASTGNAKEDRNYGRER
jgi:hypothetical protein